MIRRHTSGFTLLEVMVVLVLVGLITTLLMEGFSQVLVLRSRYLVQLDSQRSGILQEYWFRSVVTSLLPVAADDPDVFRGTASRFSGVTLAPLDDEAGVPRAFTWTLAREADRTALAYQPEGGQPWRIASWKNVREQGFRYLDVDGHWQDRWPVEGQEATLPRGIMLLRQRRQAPVAWIVTIDGRDAPPEQDVPQDG